MTVRRASIALFLVTILILPETKIVGQTNDRRFSDIERPFRYGTDQIELIFEPSFRDGVLVTIQSMNGKALLFAYKLHCTGNDNIEFHSINPTEEIASLELSKEEYVGLTNAMEGAELHSEAVQSEPGPDGFLLLFRRQHSGRRFELRYWTPKIGSASVALATRILSVAKLKPDIILGDAPIILKR